MFSAFQTFGRLGAGARAVAAAWSPASLFAAGEAGGLWDFSTLANLYQDSAGTTPCTAVGDPIGKVLDTSGRGNHLTQSTSTKRPTLGYDSGTGLYYASFDGVDDCLVSPSIDFTGTDKMTVWAGCHATATDVAVLCDLGVHLTQTGTFTFLRPNSAGATPGSKFQIYSTPPDKYSSLYTVQAIGTDEVYTLAANKALSTNEVTMRLNGASVGAADFNDDVAGTFGNYPLYVGQRGAASLPYKGFLSALCTRGAATDATTVTSMEKWLAARTPGVTLP